MKRISIRWLIVLLLWPALIGCGERAPAAPTPIPDTPSPIAVSQPTLTPTATATAAPTATPTPTTTPTPSPTATATSLPAAVIGLPAQWLTPTMEILAALPAERGWQWRVIPLDDPLAGLAGGEVDLALAPSALGEWVGARPLALTVPFTAAWEQTSVAQAAEILEQGHTLVEVMDWREMSPERKALRVNGLLPHEAGYPLQQNWSLLAAAGYEAAAQEAAPLLAPLLAGEPLIHLTAVGDIMLDRSLGRAIQQGNLEYPFQYVAHLLQAADITVGNLECALGDVGEPENKAYPFRAPPEAAQSLALAGFDILSLANNHAMDYGPEALRQGMTLLREAGIATVGAGANSAEARAPHFVEMKGIRLAFLGYVHVPVEWRGFDARSWTATADSAGLAWGDPEIIHEDVTAVRPQADLVIVILHSGYEYVAAPSPPQVAAAKAAIDAGANLVIGHHAHILQGIEFYNGGVIAYGLGNFAFEIDGPPETALLNVWLDRRGVRQIELLPAIVQFGGQPRPATEPEAVAIRQQVYDLTRLLNE